jgi:hypothetical protein
MVEPRLPSAPQLRQPSETGPPPRAEVAPVPAPPAPPPDLDQTVAPSEPQETTDVKVAAADRIEPPAEHAAPPAPIPPPPPPPEEDAPGAFMDLLARAEPDHDDGKKPS